LIERGPIIIPYFFPTLAAMHNSFTGLQVQAFPGRTDLAAIQPA
jgi:peptide/nickel transport system substrate-binding protein